MSRIPGDMPCRIRAFLVLTLALGQCMELAEQASSAGLRHQIHGVRIADADLGLFFSWQGNQLSPLKHDGALSLVDTNSNDLENGGNEAQGVFVPPQICCGNQSSPKQKFPSIERETYSHHAGHFPCAPSKNFLKLPIEKFSDKTSMQGERLHSWLQMLCSLMLHRQKFGNCNVATNGKMCFDHHLGRCVSIVVVCVVSVSCTCLLDDTERQA